MTPAELLALRERVAHWPDLDRTARGMADDRARLLADYDHLVEVARGLADVSEEAWGAADCGYVPNDRVRAAMKDRIAALRALIDPAPLRETGIRNGEPTSPSGQP